MNSTKINSNNINIDLQLAEICGIHAGDGYLRNDGRRKEWDISGNVEEKDYYDKHLIPLFNKTFKLNIEGRFFRSRNTYGFVIRDPKIIEFAHNVLGFPYGNKSLKIKAPEFIFKNSSLMVHFLRGYFDTDGHFSCVKRYGNCCEFKNKVNCYPRLIFTTVAHHLSDNLRDLLKAFGLRFFFHNYRSLIKTESLKYIYELNGIERVKKFMNLVKPQNIIKKSRYLIWVKFGFCPTNITYQQRLNILEGKISPYIFYKGL
ncbi:MAG: LAGLIDADG family homing endonuclease [Candidatus Woesearchaeota archaeon]|nr:LAGLIDADG family homing endonuclease [Candidatus Woesearchaeota archaeon]